ncbi:MAG: hypothetical protein ACJ758_09070 [Actinomycetota bacterium]
MEDVSNAASGLVIDLSGLAGVLSIDATAKDALGRITERSA